MGSCFPLCLSFYLQEWGHITETKSCSCIPQLMFQVRPLYSFFWGKDNCLHLCIRPLAFSSHHTQFHILGSPHSRLLLDCAMWKGESGCKYPFCIATPYHKTSSGNSDSPDREELLHCRWNDSPHLIKSIKSFYIVSACVFHLKNPWRAWFSHHYISSYKWSLTSASIHTLYCSCSLPPRNTITFTCYNR